MCGDCWNAAMGAPAAVVAGRFAWVSYRDRLSVVPAWLRRGGRDDAPPSADGDPAVGTAPDAELCPVGPAGEGGTPSETAVAEGSPAGHDARGEASDRLVGSPG